MRSSSREAVFLCLVIVLGGCTPSNVVPTSLQAQVDKSLTFVQLRESPDSYRGRVFVLGGEVLSAKRLKEGTRIEVLQLPLNGSLEPEVDRTRSQGRFIAIQKEFLDPATIPPDTRLTITGEVTGAVTDKLDETDYTYPVLEIKALKVWPRPAGQYMSPRYYPGYTPSYFWWPYYYPHGRIR